MDRRRHDIVWRDASQEMAERRDVRDGVQRTDLVEVYLAHRLSVRLRFRRRKRPVDAFDILADGRIEIEVSYDMQHVGKRAVFVMVMVDI